MNNAQPSAPALPHGEEKRAVVEAMFDRIATRYERVNRVISLGQDVRWRRRAVRALELPAGARVLDLACGTGDLCRHLELAGYQAVGVDRSAGMLRSALVNAPLVRGDAEWLPVPNASLDGIVCGFALRNFIDLDAVFVACAQALVPNGRFVALDAAVPAHSIGRLGNTIWFRGAVPLIGRLLAGDSEAYQYLPRSTAYLPSPDALLARLEAAGFSSLHRITMTSGSVQLLIGSRS